MAIRKRWLRGSYSSARSVAVSVACASAGRKVGKRRQQPRKFAPGNASRIGQPITRLPWMTSRSGPSSPLMPAMCAHVLGLTRVLMLHDN